MMKLPNTEDFNIKEIRHFNHDFLLVTPTDMGVKWNDDNARFRSCLLDKETLTPVSQGYPKFTNFGETPTFQPWNPDWPVVARRKIDGSLLIVSRWEDETILRTRGTADARFLPNGYEIDVLLERYPQLRDNKYLRNGWSMLFEWTTPNNIIVIRESNDIEITLLGLIDNETATLMTPENVDAVAKFLGFKRPQEYRYSSISKCIEDVALWTGCEGVVITSPDGQTLKKIKAEAYLTLHRIATGIKNIKHVMTLFIQSPRFTVAKDFRDYVETTLDYEIAEKIKDDVETVVTVYNRYLDMTSEIGDFVRKLSGMTRKEQALKILDQYCGWMSGIAFSLLDGREISEKQFEDAMFTLLEIYGN
jgi:hypothetical protein